MSLSARLKGGRGLRQIVLAGQSWYKACTAALEYCDSETTFQVWPGYPELHTYTCGCCNMPLLKCNTEILAKGFEQVAPESTYL